MPETIESKSGVHLFFDTDTERYQADCDNCGWHTRESGSRPWAATMVDQHVQDCPRLSPITQEQADKIGRPFTRKVG